MRLSFLIDTPRRAEQVTAISSRGLEAQTSCTLSPHKTSPHVVEPVSGTPLTDLLAYVHETMPKNKQQAKADVDQEQHEECSEDELAAYEEELFRRGYVLRRRSSLSSDDELSKKLSPRERLNGWYAKFKAEQEKKRALEKSRK